MPESRLLELRKEFPILETSNYLVSNSLGAMPRSVSERLKEYTDDWSTLGVRAWADSWWERPVSVGDEIAPLINAPAGRVAMQPNVTIAQSAILSSLDFSGERDTVIMTELDFPSVRYAYEELARKFGARVVVIPSEDGISIDHDVLLNAIDERTRLVSISHVLFKSAYIMDADRICAHAHRMGALVSLDAYHSVGIIPVDVQRSGVDFLTGGVLKWLCGGPGGAFLYASERAEDFLSKGQGPHGPAITGWQAHQRPFGFEQQMDYAGGAWKWLTGTPAIPILYLAAEGSRIIRQAGIDNVRAKSLRQTQMLIEMADSRGYKVHAPRDPERRGGTVAFDVPHGFEVAQYLLSQQIIVDFRVGAGIRIAPHFYTTDEEIIGCVEAIDHCIESGEWKKFSGTTSVVT